MTSISREESSSTNPIPLDEFEVYSPNNPSTFSHHHDPTVGQFTSGINRILFALAFQPFRIINNFPLTSVTQNLPETFSIASDSGPISYNFHLIKDIEKIFRRGSSEIFRDGEISRFSLEFTNFLNVYGQYAFSALSEYLFNSNPDPSVVSEALNWIAEFRNASTKSEQWLILERMLNSQSPRIRDSAVLGFGIMDDPASIDLLNNANKMETNPEISKLIENIIKQLENTRDDTPTSQNR